MTENDKDAIIGRAVREDAENSRNLAIIESELRQMSDCFLDLSHGLASNRSEITFDSDAMRVPASPNGPRVIPIRFFNFEFIKARLEEYRLCVEKRAKLDKELEQLGFRSSPRRIPVENVSGGIIR
jgi:hypothetical protein